MAYPTLTRQGACPGAAVRRSEARASSDADPLSAALLRESCSSPDGPAGWNRAQCREEKIEEVPAANVAPLAALPRESCRSPDGPAGWNRAQRREEEVALPPEVQRAATMPFAATAMEADDEDGPPWQGEAGMPDDDGPPEDEDDAWDAFQMASSIADEAALQRDRTAPLELGAEPMEDDHDDAMIDEHPYMLHAMDPGALGEEEDWVALGEEDGVTRKEHAAQLRQRQATRRANHRRDAALKVAAAQSVLDAATAAVEPSAARQSWKRLAAAVASNHGAHASHTIRASGDEEAPLIFCPRCGGFASIGALGKLAAPCTGQLRKGRWPEWELRLLEAGVRPGPKACLPEWARRTSRRTE